MSSSFLDYLNNLHPDAVFSSYKASGCFYISGEWTHLPRVQSVNNTYLFNSFILITDTNLNLNYHVNQGTVFEYLSALLKESKQYADFIEKGKKA